MSGVMKPFETLFGVVSSRSAPEPDADVAVVRGDEALHPETAPHFDDVEPRLVLVGIRHARSAARRVKASRHCSEQNHTVAPSDGGAEGLARHDERAADRILASSSRAPRRPARAALRHAPPATRPPMKRPTARSTKSAITTSRKMRRVTSPSDPDPPAGGAAGPPGCACCRPSRAFFAAWPRGCRARWRSPAARPPPPRRGPACRTP